MRRTLIAVVLTAAIVLGAFYAVRSTAEGRKLRGETARLTLIADRAEAELRVIRVGQALVLARQQAKAGVSVEAVPSPK